MKPHLRATHEPPKLTLAAERLLEILRTHCLGKANAKRAWEIERDFEIGARQQQRLLHDLRRCGHILGGGCSEAKGYWYAQGEEEKREVVAGFLSRTRDMEETVRQMLLNNPEVAQLQLATG